jgi:hypothetical protein
MIFKPGGALGVKPIFLICKMLLQTSVPEPHLLVRAGAGAVMQCGSGSDGSGSDNGNKHGWELKIDTKCNSLWPIQFIFSAIKIVQNHMWQVLRRRKLEKRKITLPTILQYDNGRFPWQIRLISTGSGSDLKGQSHEIVYKFLTWDGSFSLN